MTHGACASGDLYSARAGADVLAAGGNAVDAAVAAALMAAFSLPTMTSLAGGGIMTLCVDGEVVVCDHFAAIPGLGRPQTTWREPEVIYVPFEGVRLPFWTGRPSIAVPGNVSGMWEVHRRYGRLPMADVAGPAIRAARGGVEVTEGQQRAFALLEAIFRRTPQAWALTGRGDRLLQEGERMHNAPLAATLEQLVEEGPDAFYKGPMARALVEVSEGLVTEQDLAAYRTEFRRPLRGSYRGLPVRVPAMPSFVGTMLLCSLHHLDATGALPPTDELAFWSRLVDALHASSTLRTPEYEERLFEEGFLEGVLASCPGGNTMQISCVDEDGNAAAYTTTVGEGAGFVIPGTGVMINNFLGERDILPDHVPRVPGNRMMTGMCPTLVRDAHGRWLALGAAGSARIRSALLQVLVHIVDGEKSLQDAIDQPRIHAEGTELFVEAYGRRPAEVETLRPLGETMTATYEAGFFFGGVQAAAQTKDGFAAGADTTRRGCAAFVV